MPQWHWLSWSPLANLDTHLFCLINGFLLNLWLLDLCLYWYFNSYFTVCLLVVYLYPASSLPSTHGPPLLVSCIRHSHWIPFDTPFSSFSPAPSHRHTRYIFYIKTTLLQWSFCLVFCLVNAVSDDPAACWLFLRGWGRTYSVIDNVLNLYR